MVLRLKAWESKSPPDLERNSTYLSTMLFYAKPPFGAVLSFLGVARISCHLAIAEISRTLKVMNVIATRPTTTMYLLRHAEAEGWGPNDGLTADGSATAQALVPVLQSLEVDGVFSSPAARARATVRPYADHAGLSIVTMPDLREHQLSLQAHDPTDPLIQQRFESRAQARPGGESFNAAVTRLRNAISQLSNRPVYAPVLATHGGLIAGLLSAMDKSYGFAEFQNMPRPALFRLTHRRGTISALEPLEL